MITLYGDTLSNKPSMYEMDVWITVQRKFFIPCEGFSTVAFLMGLCQGFQRSPIPSHTFLTGEKSRENFGQEESIPLAGTLSYKGCLFRGIGL
ncbi:hypothetical protein TNCV_1527871 [Trichonephila clavipes]|nr:hypothetical protein TNCV_1527871 [Trichonephila clavipes]